MDLVLPLNIRNKDDLEDWLRAQRSDDAAVIATRAALRVLPDIVPLVDTDVLKESAVSEIFAAVFRAGSLAFAVDMFPNRQRDLRIFAIKSLHDIGNAVDLIEVAVHHISPAIAARDDLADAAVDLSGAADTIRQLHYALHMHFFNLRANYYGSCKTVNSLAIKAVGVRPDWDTLNSDALQLESGVSAAALAAKRLWPNGCVPIVVEKWRKLAAALPKDADWDVWIEWYERRWHGEKSGDAYELLFARVPNEEWKKGSAAANGWIKAELARLESAPALGPTDAEIRGRLLKHFYDLRRSNEGWVPTTDEILAGPDYVGPQVRQIIASVCQQLADAGEIKWEPFTEPNEGHVIGRAIITGHGADVVAGSRESSIDIRFPGVGARGASPGYLAAVPSPLAPARSSLAPALTASEVLGGSRPIEPSAPLLETAAPASLAAEAKKNELLTLKPTFMGMSIDLKEAGRRLWSWWKERK